MCDNKHIKRGSDKGLNLQERLELRCIHKADVKEATHPLNNPLLRKGFYMVLPLTSLTKQNIAGRETNYTVHCSNQFNKINLFG